MYLLMRRLMRLCLLAAIPVVLVTGLAPAAHAGPDPWEIIGGSPPIWDRCGLPGSGC